VNGFKSEQKIVTVVDVPILTNVTPYFVLAG